MRIRKLELAGFKSFADRTVFHFGQGVSGIVGPNGCGKSNVVDALKWCIGEQSARSLRGESMADVIFAGSSGRAPVSMAEVSLTLFAGEQPFPGVWARFSELEVARRLFRDGHSEYLINQERVRLRDIQDLFLDTGIGNQLYSFIEQGRIGQIIHARPESRRQLIDEAAGITRFKARREETLERLAQAREAVVQTEARAQELFRQLKSAERQLKTAWRWLALSARLRQAETVHQLARFTALEARKTHISTQLVGLQQSYQRLRVELQANEQQAEALRVEQQSQEAEATRLKEALLSCEAQSKALEQASQFQQREAEQQKARMERLQKEAAELEKEQIKALTEASGHARARQETDRLLKAAEAGLQSSNLEVVRAAEELRSARESRDQASRRSKEAFEVLAKARAESISWLSRQQELQPKEAKLKNQEVAVKKTIEQLAGQLQSLSERQKLAETDSILAQKMVEQARVLVQTAEAAWLQAGRDEKKAESLLTEATREREKVKVRVDSLEDLQRKSPEIPDGMRAALAVSGTMGVLGQHLEVEEPTDKLLAALLDGGLDLILVPDAARALAVARAAKGRVRMLIPPKEAPPLSGLGLLVRADTAGKAALGALLPCSEVVPNLSVALENWVPGKAIVTQDGALIRADGVIVLGGSEEGVGAVAIRRKREILALREKLQLADTELLAAKTAAARSQEQTRSLETALAAARQESSRLQADARIKEGLVLELKSRVRELESESARSQRLQESTSAELASLSLLQSRSDSELSRIKGVISEFEQKHQDAEARLQTANQQISQGEPAYAALAASIQKLRSDIGHLQRELSTWTAAEATAMERARATSRRVEAMAEESLGLEKRLAELQEESASALAERSQLQAQKESIEQECKTVRERVQSNKERLKEGESALRQARVQLEASQKHCHRLENEEVAVQTEIQHLTQDAQDRLQLSLGALLEKMTRDQQLLLKGFEPGRLEGGPSGESVPVLRVSRDQLDALARSLPLVELQDAFAQAGGVNMTAEEDYREALALWTELDLQRNDLQEAARLIEESLNKLDRTCRERFDEAFKEVNRRFGELYPKLVGGGAARLQLVGQEESEQSIFSWGVDIFVQPPGKRIQNLSLLSGGEKAMAALALVFALFSVRPSPFCVLDEVDAPLDEANGARYNEMLKEMSAFSQFIVVTHNKKTMEGADTLYGVTMPEPGISRLVAVQID
jgi:chromosome segregation protein